MDIKQINYLIDEQIKFESVSRYLNVLDMADSFYIAGVAVHTQKGKGHRVYKRWHKKIEIKIKKIMGLLETQSTIWDRMDRNKNKKKSRIILN